METSPVTTKKQRKRPLRRHRTKKSPISPQLSTNIDPEILVGSLFISKEWRDNDDIDVLVERGNVETEEIDVDASIFISEEPRGQDDVNVLVKTGHTQTKAILVGSLVISIAEETTTSIMEEVLSNAHEDNLEILVGSLPIFISEKSSDGDDIDLLVESGNIGTEELDVDGSVFISEPKGYDDGDVLVESGNIETEGLDVDDVLVENENIETEEVVADGFVCISEESHAHDDANVLVENRHIEMEELVVERKRGHENVVALVESEHEIELEEVVVSEELRGDNNLLEYSAEESISRCVESSLVESENSDLEESVIGGSLGGILSQRSTDRNNLATCGITDNEEAITGEVETTSSMITMQERRHEKLYTEKSFIGGLTEQTNDVDKAHVDTVYAITGDDVLREIVLPLAKVVLPLAEDVLPLAEDVLPLAEDVLPLAKDVLPLTEDVLPSMTPAETVIAAPIASLEVQNEPQQKLKKRNKKKSKKQKAEYNAQESITGYVNSLVESENIKIEKPVIRDPLGIIVSQQSVDNKNVGKSGITEIKEAIIGEVETTSSMITIQERRHEKLYTEKSFIGGLMEQTNTGTTLVDDVNTTTGDDILAELVLPSMTPAGTIMAVPIAASSSVHNEPQQKRKKRNKKKSKKQKKNLNAENNSYHGIFQLLKYLFLLAFLCLALCIVFRTILN